MPAESTTTAPATSTSTTPVTGGATAVFEYLDALTSIRPHAGWRSSAASGEAQALDFVADVLGGFPFLQSLGLELERQVFPVFAATELRESRLFLTVDGREIEVVADAPRGHRHDADRALRADSDGGLNDSEPDPVVAEGRVAVVRSQSEIAQLREADLRGAIVFIDYGIVSPASCRPPKEPRR